MPEPPSCETQECLGDRLCVAGSCIPHAAGTVPESDGACVRPFVPGVFSPTIRCEWSGPPAGDPFPAYNHLIATPVVADLDLDGDPSAVRPSILVPTAASGCDTPNSKGGGVIRVIDGATCAQQATLPGTVTAAAALAVADLDLDGRPEVVAVNPSGGPRAYRYDEASATWAVMWNATKAGGGASKPYANSWRYAGCSIVQVRPDPAPEVMLGGVLYDANGREVATNLQNKNVAQGLRTPVVADVDSDGEGELVTGDGVWRLDDARGRFVKESWFRGTGSDGFVALADFGSFPVAGLGEPLPEVVVVQGGKVRVQDLSGRAVFGPYNLPLIPPAPDRGHGGPPTVADFDGDGRPEAALAGRGAYAVFDLDCAGDPAPFGCWGPGILWAMPSQDYSSSVTGSSIFDFEGDGIAEGIYADECYVRVYHGNTGEVLFSQARQSGTWYENPIIADANGDHRTEIVQGSNELCGVRCPALDPYFRGLRCTEPEDCASGECATGYCRCTNDAGCGGLQSGYTCTNPLPNTPGDGKVCRAHHQGSYRWLRVYGDARDAWVDSRPIWHQHTYFLANVLDDGTVPPADAHRPWAVPSYNAFRQNRQTGDPRAAADLTVRILYAGNCDPEGYLSVHAEVCNRGAAPAPRGAPLAFFDGLPGFGARVLCLHETSADLFGGDCEQHSCTFRLEDPEVQHTIAVSADHGPGLGAVRECRESNNGDLLDGVTCENQR